MQPGLVVSQQRRYGHVGDEYARPVIVAAAPIVQASRRDSAERRRRNIGLAFSGLHGNVEATALRVQASFWRTLSDQVMARLKAAGAVGVNVDEIFRPAVYRDAFNRSLRPAWSLAIYSGVQFEADWIGQRESRQSFFAPFRQDVDELPPSFHVDLSTEMQKRIRDFLKAREVGVWDKVGDTVHDRLRRALQRGLKEGDSFDRMQDRVREVLKSHSDYAARRIARTETTGAMNAGQQIERDDIGVEQKEWTSRLDARTRGADPGDAFDHLDADGQVVANDGLFVVSGQQLAYPCDGSHGASSGNIINCRCTGVAAFGDELLVKPAAASTAPQLPTPGEAKSIKEAEDVARQLNLADTINYKGMSVEVANAMNLAVHDALKLAPELRVNQRFLGTNQERNNHLVAVRLAREIDQLRKNGWLDADIKKATPILRARLRKSVEKISERMWASSWGQDVPFADIVSGIAVNRKHAERPESWLKSLAANVKSGFHPPGSESIRSVFDHEMGHQLEDLLKLTQKSRAVDPDFKALIAQWNSVDIIKGLSRYAATDHSEIIAEAWAEYRNSKNPRPIAEAIGKLIEKKLEEHRKAASS